MTGTLLAAAAALVLVVRVVLPQRSGETSSMSPAMRGAGDVVRPADPRVVALAAALGTTRPVEGRLTGGFSYGEVRTPDRSLAPTDNLALIAAAGEIQKRAGANPSAANLHAWGVAQLLVGRHDASVETLESVWTEQRHDPRVAADLGTARLARAGALDAPEDLPRALEALEQALTLDPDLRGGMVHEGDRARAAADPSAGSRGVDQVSAAGSGLLVERRSPPPARGAGFSTVPAPVDGDRSRAARSGGRSPRSFVRRSRATRWKFESSWCASSCQQWAAEAGSASGDARLDQAQRIIEALEHSGPDHSLGAAITEIRRGGAARRTLIAAGIRELAAGFAAQSAERPVAEIRPRFEAAARQLRAGRSTLDVWAAFALARLAVVQQRHDEVVSTASLAAARAKRIGAAAVEARAHWLLGMTAFTTNNWSAAMRHYEDALRLCDATAETTLASSVHLNASVLNRFLGNVGATWRHRLDAGAELPPSPAGAAAHLSDERRGQRRRPNRCRSRRCSSRTKSSAMPPTCRLARAPKRR